MASPAPTINSFIRPATRGELAKRIKAGETCEVAGHVEEFTSMMLRAWLDLENFQVTPSPNAGWVLYSPKPAAR